MLQLLIMILAFVAVGFLSYQYIPVLVGRVHDINVKRAEKFSQRMDNLFLRVKTPRMIIFYLIAPAALGLIGFLTFHNLLAVLVGMAIVLVLPSGYAKYVEKARKSKFSRQLIDCLMLLSSSLKGGLSLIQAIEVMVEEMPAPISQEFGIVLSENKLGIPLDESFKRLYKRMPSNELNQMITAILLARETGGNLPFIFGRLVTTLRENNKIIKDIQGLTLQGRIQGVIMASLPVVFAMFVFTVNPKFFDVMFASELGKTLLIVSLFLEVIGMFLIRKISRIDF
jgi:tight adherence protein B